MQGENKRMTAGKAFDLLAAYCAKAERAPYDVINKLRKWQFNQDEAQKILNRLIESHYVDELRYAKAYVHDKQLFNKWGKIKIKNMLKIKGISEDAVNQAIRLLDDVDEQDELFLLLQRKQSTISNREPEKQKQSLLRFAASRGYSLDDALKCINRLEF